MEWEKIVVNDAMDKGLISKMYKQLSTTQPPQQRKPLKQMKRQFKDPLEIE